jgi:hypothetical protein
MVHRSHERKSPNGRGVLAAQRLKRAAQKCWWSSNAREEGFPVVRAMAPWFPCPKVGRQDKKDMFASTPVEPPPRPAGSGFPGQSYPEGIWPTWENMAVGKSLVVDRC